MLFEKRTIVLSEKEQLSFLQPNNEYVFEKKRNRPF